MEIAEPVNCRVSVDQHDDLLEMRWRTSSRLIVAISVLWSIVWSGVCIFLIGVAAREPRAEYFFLAVPFLAGWVWTACVLPRVFFGVECLRVGPDGLDYRNRAIFTLVTRHVPLAEVKGAAPYEFVIQVPESRMSENGMKVLTRGRPLRVGLGLAPAELHRLADLIGRHLRRLRPELLTPPRDLIAKDGVAVLIPTGPAPAPPWDCGIRSHVAGDRTTFVRRGYVEPPTLVGLTLMCAIFLAAVGLGVCSLITGFHADLPLFELAVLDLAHLVFLLPPAAIGLIFVAAWLAALTAPLRVEAWEVGSHEIAVRSSFLGLGRTRRHGAASLARIEWRSGVHEARGFRFHRDEDDTPHSLGLVGRDDQDLLVIDDLTEGEALWMGAVFCEVLKRRPPMESGPSRSPPCAAASLWDREIDG